MPTIAEALTIAIQHHRRGDLHAAEQTYREILRAAPNHSEALHLLGLLAHQTERHKLAVEFIEQAIRANGNLPEYYFTLGLARQALQMLPEAITCYRQALQLNPDFAACYNNLGNALREQGRFDEAADCFERVLIISPSDPVAHNNLGNALMDQGKLPQATASYRRALTLAPDFAEGHDNLGNVFREQGMLDEAIASHRRSLELKPSVARTHNHLGNAFRDAGMTEEAEACYRRALELNPDFPHALYNLGNTVRELGKITEAISLYRRALQLSPSFAEAEFNLASALLLLGSYEEGWARYESRRALFPPGTPSSLFGRGTPTDGQTILLQCEQGFGDTLQFLRYAVWMSAQMPMARITLESPPELARLLDQSVRGRIEVIPRQIGVESETPKADRSLPLLSLPWALRMIEPLPMSAPYLHVDPAIKTKWRDRLRPTPKLRVGLAWKGRQGPKVKRARSLPCEKLLGLFESPSVELYSLQMGADPSEQAALAASGVIDLAPQIRDFADTAAIVAELDLILSIDTALAHLAGALGRPVWTFLKYVPDWRWGMQGESTAWYPTMRLFRQSARDDWDSVLDRIRVELAFAKSAGIARTTDSSPAFVQA